MANNPPQYTDAERGIRIQKALANAGVAARRECEKLVTDGRVTVNGDRITQLPAWVDPAEDRIAVDGEDLPRPRKSKSPTAGKIYLLVNKPAKVLSTNDDPDGRPRVIDLVDYPGNPRLFPVGRLDADSTGLILLTNDGELTNRLTHPRYEVLKQYEVKIKGRLTGVDVEKLRKGLILAHKPADAAAPRPKKAAMESVKILGHERDATRGDRTTLGITLREGQNREIRRLLARLGFNVRKLKRTAIGPLRLKGVPMGAWRPLTSHELQKLRHAAGLK